MLIRDLLYRQKNNSNTAIIQGDRKISFVEWNRAASDCSKLINELLTRESANIAVIIPNSIEYAIAYFSIQYANRVVVPIGPKSTQSEILSTLEYCEVDLIVTDDQNFDGVETILKNSPFKSYLLNINNLKVVVVNPEKTMRFKTSYLVAEPDSEDDTAILLHTSGTTNAPKRVMLTHKNLICNVESNILSLELRSNDVVLIALPMYFGYCNTAQFLTHLYLGAKIVILDSLFMPKQFLKDIEKHQITNFTAVPTMLLMLLSYRYSNQYDISSLRYICFGGGRMPVDKLSELIEKYPTVGFVQTYGQTECSPRVTALLPQFSSKKVGSVGKPIPNVKAIIVDEDGNSCSPFSSGEIYVSGNNVMKGYYKRPDITRKTIVDGWIHTGDVGYQDEEGFIYLNGRIKNMIISGGINIYPEEIEQILLSYNGIKEAVVVGEDDDLLGEVPVAKIVVSKSIDIGDLKTYCRRVMSDYKVPTKFDIVEDLPHTYNGKNVRFFTKDLREHKQKI